MNTYNVTLLVRQVTEGDLMGLFVRDDLKWSFVPTVGMQFKKGSSTWLWETYGGELMPSVETVTYDLDEDTFVCLLTVDDALSSSFWTHIPEEELESSGYLAYFQPRH